ncbi:MAG: acyltransferase domain-containing protein [Candidatus Azobacteroides sp.]|nr:acyltransferase domain-containing protein [Candidatus Azobacteroides sp.]
MKEKKELLILSPFESTDIQLILNTIKAGAFGVLYLGGNSEEAKKLIATLSKKARKPFGIWIGPSTVLDFVLPENVTKVIVPFDYNFKINTQAEILCQVGSVEDAKKAIAAKVSSIVIRGTEATEDSFDIFRKVIDQSLKNDVKVYVQGDVGIHTSAAFLALGARGVIFDSQIALFPECSVSVPDGWDLSLANDFVEHYRNLKWFITAVDEASYGHLHQAKSLEIVSYDETAETDSKEEYGSLPKLSIWEKQVTKMLRKEKNLSKFSLVFSDSVNDAFFSAFVSIMAAPVSVRGIKVKVSVPKDSTSGEKQKLQSDTQNLLSGLKVISPVCPAAKPLDIAIVGMECIYPAAANLDEYWRNILLAKDCISEIPASHWNKDAFFKTETANTDFSLAKWGGFIPTIDFDPVEFGIMPQTLFSTEPSHLLSILVVKRALKDAGYKNLAECDFENTSVFMGANGMGNSLVSKLLGRSAFIQIYGGVPDEIRKFLPPITEYSFSGILPNLLTGRIANRMNFGGQNYTVDAACASSLATLSIACNELSSGHSDMVVFGGSDLTNTYGPYLLFSHMHLLSPKGRCAAFDSSADGIVVSEGIGVLILKRLEDAERDNNKIYAVIRGIGGSSDGRNLSVTAPSRKGEGKALERAYQNAGIFPAEVGLIEAHGTGTVVGDKVELNALTDLFIESGALPGQTFIGSVKTQIGHTKCAAGVAGLIKTVLSVYHGIIPPTIHIDSVNAFYNPQTSPFVFNKRAGLWNSEKRIAGVSAFGFGGTNFHTVIENYSPNPPEKSVFEVWPSELFVFRGDSLNEAKAVMQKVKKLLELNNTLRLADIAYSLALYNNKDVQVSIVADTVEELLTKIKAVMEDRMEFKIYRRSVKEGKIAFMFSGEGSQYVNMARDLFVAFPPMRWLLKRHSEYIRILFPETAFDEETREAQEKTMIDIHVAQPSLGIVDIAIAECLRFLGIIPDMVAGHSYGEIPALCFAGAFSRRNLVAISEDRAKAIYDVIGEENRGKSVAVITTEEELKVLLEGETEVWAVNHNSPKQIVVAGTAQGIESFLKKAAGKNIICKEINGEYAFHSPLLAKAEKLYAEALKAYDFKSPEIPVWSNMTGEIYPKETDTIKMYMAKHLDQPIEFTRQIENMYKAGARIFIETGPGRVQLGLVESVLGKKVATIQTENKSSEGISYYLKALGQYLSLGKDFHIEKLFEGRHVTFLSIDEPEKYKKSSTGWLINGNEVVPSEENELSKALPYISYTTTPPFILDKA